MTYQQLYTDLQEISLFCDRYVRNALNKCIWYMEYKYSCGGLINQSKFTINNFAEGLLRCRCQALAIGDEKLLKLLDIAIGTLNGDIKGDDESFIRAHKVLIGGLV